jgi:hypothetical protein
MYDGLLQSYERDYKFEPSSITFDKTENIYIVKTGSFDIIHKAMACLCKCEPRTTSMIVSPSIFYYICDNCESRFPEKSTGLFPVKSDFTQLLINNGIINQHNIAQHNINNGIIINNNNSIIEKYQYLKDYPLPYNIINNEKIYDSLRIIIRKHSKKDIYNFILDEMNKDHSRYNDNNIYKNTNGDYKKLTDHEIQDSMQLTMIPYIEKYIDFYNFQEDPDKVFILKNLYELKDIITDYTSEENVISRIKSEIASVQKFTPLDTCVDFMNSKIVYEKGSHIKLIDLYKEYKYWRNNNTELLKKQELRMYMEDHLKQLNWKMNYKYSRQQINDKKVTCWKHVKLISHHRS